MNNNPDGTTVLAVAFGRLNVEIIKALVSSEGIVNSKRNEYLAQVAIWISFSELPLTDEEKREIKTCCKVKQPCQEWSIRDSCRYTIPYPEWVYPHFNEESEHNLGRLNRGVKEQILSLGEKTVITEEECLQHILGNFCIRSPKGSWAISDDILLNQECNHREAKR